MRTLKQLLGFAIRRRHHGTKTYWPKLRLERFADLKIIYNLRLLEVAGDLLSE